MGSTLGPHMAKMFVGFRERQLFDNISKPYCYCWRHIYDVLSRRETEKMSSLLNNLQTYLKYTMEMEEKNQVPFLDMLFERTP